VIGGRNGAAARLGVPRTTLMYKMQRLGINRGRGLCAFAKIARSSD
jgi:DNA-binding NtrC family response regulator